jgi:hypothetical protein
MRLLSLFLIGCFPELNTDKANTFVDNPDHDYDDDGEFDATDCDDGNFDIKLPIIIVVMIWIVNKGVCLVCV